MEMSQILTYLILFIIKQTYRKFMGNIKEKKVGVAGFEPLRSVLNTINY